MVCFYCHIYLGIILIFEKISRAVNVTYSVTGHVVHSYYKIPLFQLYRLHSNSTNILRQSISIMFMLDGSLQHMADTVKQMLNSHLSDDRIIISLWLGLQDPEI